MWQKGNGETQNPSNPYESLGKHVSSFSGFLNTKGPNNNFVYFTLCATWKKCEKGGQIEWQ